MSLNILKTMSTKGEISSKRVKMSTILIKKRKIIIKDMYLIVLMYINLSSIESGSSVSTLIKMTYTLIMTVTKMNSKSKKNLPHFTSFELRPSNLTMITLNSNI